MAGGDDVRASQNSCLLSCHCSATEMLFLLRMKKAYQFL